MQHQPRWLQCRPHMGTPPSLIRALRLLRQFVNPFSATVSSDGLDGSVRFSMQIRLACALALAASVAMASTSAEAGGGRNGALAAGAALGVVGGVLLGSALSNNASAE